MRKSYYLAARRYTLVLAVIAGAAVLPSATKRTVFTPRDKAYYANQNTINFVRPGLTITIVSAKIAADGTLSVDYKLTDPKGVGLDRLGISTPGAISTSFLVTYLPKGQTQYVSYVTRNRASTDGKNTAVQATGDTGGVQTQVAEGEYVYTFATKLPKTFDPTATHQVGIYGSRNLTEFDLGTFYDDAVFDWVPAGGTPAPRDVVKTASCNKCHDQLAFHGGSRRSVELCIMCHQPQTSEANGGKTVDFKVMIHKIHMGSQLPSVVAKTPYAIGSTDWSTVVFPSDPRRCESCHEPKSGAVQASAWYTNPSRAACGSCHDDVNFATGTNHVNLPQVDDSQCATCHIPKGELEYDASIQGAHILPQESATRPGIVINLVKVDNGAAGQKPTITFTLKDSSGKPIDPSTLVASPNKISFVMGGPTTDYGYTSMGSDVTSPGYVSEAAAALSKCGQDGTCTYTFTHAIPAGAKGSFAIGVEARRALTILPGTVKQLSTQYGADNKVIYFSVDGSPMVKRRQVVDIAKCNQCHTRLSMHGENRNNTEYCVLCHNPSNQSGAAPKVGIDLSVMVHSIHFGDNLAAAGATYKIGTADFSDVRYPAFSPTGRPGDTTNCAMCHVNGSEAIFPIGKNGVVDPGAAMDPAPATTAACAACHVTRSNMAHMVAQTDPKFGESCDVCHATGAQFDVAKEHAGK
jgi:OmcA/MtrC family decaheme c-type cytochrome